MRLIVALAVAGVLVTAAYALRPGEDLPAPTASAIGAATSAGASTGPAPTPSTAAAAIGDGSTADTGPQPHQPAVTRLSPGQRPPQFVVVSWDGAGETSGLFAHFREFAQRHQMGMTFFVSGIYLLPESRRADYHPPRHAVGAADIGLLSDAAIRATLTQIRGAWLEGHEIGTHFNGHFCGKGGGGDWTPAEWDSEIDQAVRFVTTWRTATGFTDLPPLPFDYDKELVGSRTPCLEGQAGLVKAAATARWRYDTSGTGRQVWPSKLAGTALWNIPMQSLPVPGRTTEFLSMDYTFLANQSKTVNGDPAQRPKWQAEMRGSLLAGFARAYDGNRAPLILGNHFENWNGGIYMNAVESALTEMATKPDVRFVSFRQLCDWLDGQDPAVLAALQGLPVGSAPPGGWATLAKGSAGSTTPPATPPAVSTPPTASTPPVRRV